MVHIRHVLKLKLKRHTEMRPILFFFLARSEAFFWMNKRNFIKGGVEMAPKGRTRKREAQPYEEQKAKTLIYKAGSQLLTSDPINEPS